MIVCELADVFVFVAVRGCLVVAVGGHWSLIRMAGDVVCRTFC